MAALQVAFSAVTVLAFIQVSSASFGYSYQGCGSDHIVVDVDRYCVPKCGCCSDSIALNKDRYCTSKSGCCSDPIVIDVDRYCVPKCGCGGYGGYGRGFVYPIIAQTSDNSVVTPVVEAEESTPDTETSCVDS